MIDSFNTSIWIRWIWICFIKCKKTEYNDYLRSLETKHRLTSCYTFYLSCCNCNSCAMRDVIFVIMSLSHSEKNLIKLNNDILWYCIIKISCTIYSKLLKGFLSSCTAHQVDLKLNWKYFQRDLQGVKEYALGVQNRLSLKS